LGPVSTSREFGLWRFLRSLRRHLALVVGMLLAIAIPENWLWLKFAPELQRVLNERLEVSWLTAFAIPSLAEWVAGSIALLAVVRYWEGKSLESVGMKKPSAGDCGAALGLFLLSIVIRVVAQQARPGVRNLSDTGFALAAGVRHINYYMLGMSPAQDRRLWIVQVPPGLGYALVAADAFAEELGTRAYVIERVAALTGSQWFAAVLSLMISFGRHIDKFDMEGVTRALTLLPLLVLPVLLYMWRRNLPACALLHFLIDAVVLMLIGMPFRVQAQILRFLGFVPQLP
jgi:membrane protease YdiL (CAAX protease family)